MKGDLPKLVNCSICNHDKHDEVLRDFIDQIITGKEASEKLDCTLTKFKLHLESHVKKSIQLYTSKSIIEVSNSIIDKVAEMLDSLERNKVQMNDIIKEAEKASGKSKREWVETYLKSEKLLGDQITRLAVIQGDLKSSGVEKVQQLYIQINKIQNVIIENIKDPKQKIELAKVLERIETENEESNSSDL